MSGKVKSGDLYETTGISDDRFIELSMQCKLIPHEREVKKVNELRVLFLTVAAPIILAFATVVAYLVAVLINGFMWG